VQTANTALSKTELSETVGGKPFTFSQGQCPCLINNIKAFATKYAET